MNVAIIGSNGFIGSNLARYLSNFNIFSLNRSNIDLLDFYAVQYFLITKKIDVVINAAAAMTDEKLINDARNNIGIFLNFYLNRIYFKKFINLASASEYDRRNNIFNFSEEKIFEYLPNDSYGFGQNINSKLSCDTENFYNLRIFNCFGKNELPTRIFPRIINQDIITISNDRYFDYFFIKDLCKVVEYYITNNPPYKDINVVYMDKFLISEVVYLFCKIHNLEKTIIIDSKSNLNYTGCGSKLKSLNLHLFGLYEGLKIYFDFNS